MPFRPDHVGTLLRPAALKEARARRARGEISAGQLGAAEDIAIEGAIAKQADVGLQSATDVAFRFLRTAGLRRIILYRSRHRVQKWKGDSREGLRVREKLGFSSYPMSAPGSGNSTHCSYLQLDEANLTYLCDAEQRKILGARGGDPDRLPEIYAAMLNTAIENRPADMVITMHLCRGNFRSSWIATGGYE